MSALRIRGRSLDHDDDFEASMDKTVLYIASAVDPSVWPEKFKGLGMVRHVCAASDLLPGQHGVTCTYRGASRLEQAVGRAHAGGPGRRGGAVHTRHI
jgi:hypothetical protein